MYEIWFSIQNCLQKIRTNHHFQKIPSSDEAAVTVHLQYPSQARQKYLSQILATIAISLGPFAAGLGKGYSSPAIASLQDQLPVSSPSTSTNPHNHHSIYKTYSGESNNLSTIHVTLDVDSGGAFPITNQQTSWVASLSLLGALFGSIFGGIAMKFGRRNVLRAATLPFSISWIATVFASNVQTIYVTSFVAGFCCAVILMVSQVYISEISDTSIRGCLSAVLKIFGQIGVLVSFIMGAYLDWRQLALAISVAPLALFFITLYLPETPSYLVLTGQYQEAAKSLEWLKGGDTDEVYKELATIRQNVMTNGTGTTLGEPHPLPQCTIPQKLWHPVLITCTLMFFQRFSGANAFNSYAVPIFRRTFGGMNPHGGAIAVGFVQLLASLLSGLLIDNVGRLVLLIISIMFMSMALAAFGSYAYFQEMVSEGAGGWGRAGAVAGVHNNVSGVHYDWIPLLCVLIFTIAFSLGISPISWLLVSELFPLRWRGVGSALATSFSYGCAFVGVKTFVDFQEALGLHGAFWLYSAISIAGLCFVVCFVPETKGRDLQELDHQGNIVRE